MAPVDLLVAVSQEPLEVCAVLRVGVSSLLPSDVANENASVVFKPDGIGIMNVVALDDKSNNGARADSSKRRSMPAPNGEERPIRDAMRCVDGCSRHDAHTGIGSVNPIVSGTIGWFVCWVWCGCDDGPATAWKIQ